MSTWCNITGLQNDKCMITLSLCFAFFLELTIAFLFYIPANGPAKVTRPLGPARLTRQLWPAKLTRPSGPAKLTCPLGAATFGPADWPATFGLPNRPASLDPPVYPPAPTQNSQAGHGPLAAPPPPPAPTPCDRGEGGGGGGGGQARPARASQAGTLFYCPLQWSTYARSSYIHNISILNTERRNHFESIANLLLLGEGNYCKGGSERQVLSFKEWGSFNNL